MVHLKQDINVILHKKRETDESIPLVGTVVLFTIVHELSRHQSGSVRTYDPPDLSVGML